MNKMHIVVDDDFHLDDDNDDDDDDDDDELYLDFPSFSAGRRERQE